MARPRLDLTDEDQMRAERGLVRQTYSQLLSDRNKLLPAGDRRFITITKPQLDAGIQLLIEHMAEKAAQAVAHDGGNAVRDASEWRA